MSWIAGSYPKPEKAMAAEIEHRYATRKRRSQRFRAKWRPVRA
jgi:hypothetical protein